MTSKRMLRKKMKYMQDDREGEYSQYFDEFVGFLPLVLWQEEVDDDASWNERSEVNNPVVG